MKPTIDELYLSLNTDLIPHDLVNAVYDNVLQDWFSIACIATERGEFLIGDLGDDTKLDGRGKLVIPGETLTEDLSTLTPLVSMSDGYDRIMERLDTLNLEEEGEELQISCIGAPPSGFRHLFGQQWRPRLAPSFHFKAGESHFELSLFDSSWIDQSEDLDELASRMATLCETIGERRTSLIEFEADGRFLANDEQWRDVMAPLPLRPRDLR